MSALVGGAIGGVLDLMFRAWRRSPLEQMLEVMLILGAIGTAAAIYWRTGTIPFSALFDN